MSKSQTLADLKKTGVKLTQSEAQEIHTRVSDIAKGQHESGELFEVIEPKEMSQANNVKAINGFTPISEEKEDPADNIVEENSPEDIKHKTGEDVTKSEIDDKFDAIDKSDKDEITKVAEKVITKAIKVAKTKGEKTVKPKTAKPQVKV